MDKKQVLQAIKQAKADSKRNFKQTVDLIINLKDLDIKKQEGQLDLFITVPNALGVKKSVCALVGPELKDEAGKVCDEVVSADQFAKLGKKEVKHLAKKHDYFIAQANIMSQVATTFGKYLGPKGKMPNPKAGLVVPPKANLKPLYDKLQNTLNPNTKKTPNLQVIIGKEDMDDDKLVHNAWFVYDHIIHKLPKEANNVKNIYLKLTMGKPVKVR